MTDEFNLSDRICECGHIEKAHRFKEFSKFMNSGNNPANKRSGCIETIWKKGYRELCKCKKFKLKKEQEELKQEVKK